MAKFQKGKSGNPGGRPAIPPAIKALRKLTIADLEEIGDLILRGNRAALNAIVSDTESPAVKVVYAKGALNAMAKGDIDTLEKILARVVGPVRKDINVTGSLTWEELVAGSNDPGPKQD